MNNNTIFENAKKANLRYTENIVKMRSSNISKNLNNDIDYIKYTYDVLNKFNELGITTHLAGEWILDNFYAIQKESYSLMQLLKNTKWANSMQVTSYTKIYFLVLDFVKDVDGKINAQNIREFLKGYTQTKYISIQELWSLPVMIKVALIQNIREICEKIMYAEKQKYKVESIIERYILKEKNQDKKFNIIFKEANSMQINLPFIEYMAYRLRELGQAGAEFADVFDNQVAKMGTTVDEVVSKEHLQVAINQISIGNSILSLKNINSINFTKEFINISDIDIILSKEEAGIYGKMNEETQKKYRDEICKIAKNTGVSEKYICSEIASLCKQQKGIKAHSGYYIFSDGLDKLYEVIGANKKGCKKSDFKTKLLKYILPIWLLTFITTMLLTVCFTKNITILPLLSFLIIFAITFIPISQIYIYIIDKAIFCNVKPQILSGLDFEEKIPEEYKTMVIIPTLITTPKRVKELVVELEKMYITNKQDNIFFALLGDASESDKQIIDIDEELLKVGNEEIEKLNKKYNFEVPKFYFLYRKRKYNQGQGKYLGWERKRGMITQFNRYLIYGEKSDFYDIKMDRSKLGDIKYVLTLDADTQIGINNISKMVGIMAHPLNHPVLNEEKTAVVDGYGILQSRVSTSIKCASKNIFSAIWGGYGGIDNYTNAISDIYQDVWQEGIFTGKGIYDLRVFSSVLDNQIPENTVLSHDLLEGSFLRCGLVTNVEVVDGFPSRFNSYIVRQNRWIRGDLQVLRWCKDYVMLNGKKVKNPLNKLSKWKIIDNIRRSIIPTSLFLLILLGLTIFNIKWQYILLIFLGVYMLPCILDKVINFKTVFNITKNSTHVIGALEGCIYKTFFELAFLPYVAITNIETFIKSFYRINFSKKNMLEWLTAEQAEKVLGKELKTYVGEMYISSIWGFILVISTLIFSTYTSNYIFSIIVAILWIISPFLAWYISREKEDKVNIQEEKKDFLLNVAKDTWEYFNRYLTKENNYLIPDNYQENREPIIVQRTSSTNIGLSLIAVMSAYDLKFIEQDRAKQMITNILDTIDKLKKYRGNIYNWYDIKTLEPLNDSISSVDNGNYIGYLYVLANFCDTVLNDKELYARVYDNIEKLDFSIFYNYEKQLFSIEYNAKTGEISNSYYDLLASESRMLSYVAIAKGDVPYKHWYALSRALTHKFGTNGLLSWTGTSFEYFMPYCLMRSYKYSLIDETYAFVFKCQMEYLRNRKIPWGISESAFNLYDLEYNYQYKAFGIPSLGLKRGLKEDLVISPYASIIMLPKNPDIVISNMKALIKEGGYGKYGFYDAIDYTKNRIGNESHVVVKTFMAHHQGLILMSINNVLNNMVMQDRFHANAQIEAFDILLQEKNQNAVVIKNKLNNGIYEDKKKVKESSSDDIYIGTEFSDFKVNVLSNKNYSIATCKDGDGYSKLDDIYVYRYNGDKQNRGMNIYIKDIKNDEIYNCLENANVKFSLYRNTFVKNFNGLEIQTTIFPIEQGFGEIRNVRIKNNNEQEAVLEVFFYIEPIITKLNNDLSHRAYSNMFLQYEKHNDSIVITRRKKHLEERSIALAAKVVQNSEHSMHIEYEIDRYKFIGRNKNIENANMIKGSVPFSNTLLPTIEPILCFKVSVKVPKDTFVDIPYVLCVNDDKDKCIELIQKFTLYDNVKDELLLAYNKGIIESKFYKYTNLQIIEYSKLMSYILDSNKKNAIIENEDMDLDLKQSNLWAYGISGDKPILAITITRKIESVYIKKILKAYKYIKRKGVDFDLVIRIKSKQEYTDQIYQEVLRHVGINGLRCDINYGIYVIDYNNLNDNIKKIIQSMAVLNLDCKQYSNILKIEDKAVDKVVEKDVDKVVNITKRDSNVPCMINYDTSNLLYYNEIGGFADNGKGDKGEYQIILNNGFTTPAPWVNVIANPQFGTIVSENGIVYSWARNSGQNKLTKWSNDQVINAPSEYVVLKEADEEKVWSITSYPFFENGATYGIKYGKGYAIYESDINDIFSTKQVFVPENDKCKICICTFRNKIGKQRKISVEYNMKVLLGNETNRKIFNVQTNIIDNCLLIKNGYSNNFSSEIMYVYSFSQDYENGNVDTKCSFDISGLNVLDGNIQIVKEIVIEPYEVKKVFFMQGQEDNIDTIKDMIKKYSNCRVVQNSLESVKSYWEDLTEKIRVKTLVESMNILINEWLIYQTISCRIFARSGYYQSGGAFGFRDQLQDVLSVMFVNPQMAKTQIIYHARHQYLEGDVQHWWHPENDQGIRSRYSDDLLWLAYVVLEYIKVTGDNTILDESAGYISSNVLGENEKERYELPNISDVQESIFFHICRSIDRSIDLADNNLPNIGSGDWSDGLNNIYGQSVWLGFFLYHILNEFLPFVKDRDNERYDRYVEAIRTLKIGLENSWDGKWYTRAIFEDGNIIGSNQNDECKIDVIVQSWANIAKFGDEEKRHQALNSVDNILVDRDNKMIKLFTPSFNNTVLEPGYIKGYIPGIRENGGQYTHGAIWLVMANAINGKGNLAEEYFRMLNPIEHARTNEASRKYKTEPYVVTADIYSTTGLEGRGGWSWYTGSSSWLYKVGVEYILGLKIRGEHLKIEPCISSSWNEYEMWYTYKETKYHIYVKNPHNKEYGVSKVMLDGEEIPDKVITLFNDGKNHEVEVIM